MPFHYTRASADVGEPTFYPADMSDYDHGTNKALGSSVLQLVGGVLISSALFLGYQDGMRSQLGLLLGGAAGLYFVVSGGVRLGVAVLTRRARRAR